jgi:abequosyltransferase
MNKPTSRIKLSICIATFNRATYLVETLNSISSQVTDDCEVVVMDNASTDNTAEVVTEHSRRITNLRYRRNQTNIDLDNNFDRTVGCASGEYCWLLPDDDVLRPGAVATVLQALASDFSLVLVNYRRMDVRMKKVLLPRFVDLESDRVYSPTEFDRLFVETGGLLMYIGAVVIKRALWLARERTRFYGSMFIHVGVIFQGSLPGPALLIASPLIDYRHGNVSLLSSAPFDLLMIRWPRLVWSLAPSDHAKMQVCKHQMPCKNLKTLLLFRALGWYSSIEYERWILPHTAKKRLPTSAALIASLPRMLLNTMYMLYLWVSHDRHRNVTLKWLVDSPYSIRSRLVRHFGVR